MDVNKLFSLQNNGYKISEVDDYIGFLQTELTKNMKLSHDFKQQNNTFNNAIKKLKAENKTLNEKNQKLYRDCVAFAKRLKELEIYESSLAEFKDGSNFKNIEEIKESYKLIKEENKNLKIENEKFQSKISELTSSFNNNNIDDIGFNKNIVNEIRNNSSKDIYSSTNPKNDIPEVNDEVIEFKEESLPSYSSSLKNNTNNNIKENDIKKHDIFSTSKRKSNYPRSVLNFISTLFLCISILIGIISIFTYIFIKNPNLTIFGYRTYTVHTDCTAFNYSTDDIILVKNISPIEIKPKQVILYKDKNSSLRNIKLVHSIENKNNKIYYNVKTSNDESTFESISKNSVLGIVTAKIKYIGKIAKFAFINKYDYIAILTCVFLVNIFIKIMISISKSKERKIKFNNYDISDFSLDI